MEGHEGVREVHRECMKNHSLRQGGGYTVDGCCRFIPAAVDRQLQCGACGCHRNFHRTDFCIAGALPGRGERRRPRTRFTEEQKQRMSGCAERLGWKIPRSRARAGAEREEEDQVSRFCRGIGVTRQAFKVWMHNHKGSPSSAPAAAAAQVASSEATASGGAAMNGGVEEVIKIGDEAMEEEEAKDLD